MQLLRRSVSGEVSDARKPRRVRRGAWYPDPFGVGDERWWDGGQWTREVRSSADAERAAVSAGPTGDHSLLDASRRAAPAPESVAAGPRASEFPVGIEAVVGERLSVMPSTRKPGTHCQVLAARGRVGSISLFGHQMARLRDAHGAWLLKKSPRNTREFTIESTEHKQTGRYRLRQWMPGGAITLADGTKVELRRALPGRWKLCSADGGTCLAEVHRPVARSAQPKEFNVTVHALPVDAARASMLILAACALIMLDADIR